ncbi:polysaccharide pyruvyl transferase family protein [Alteromonas macleodii]|uniref:polysaccharide pyruvyl transferase family protein n=1 Tax=Alteromonas macleodii TaxID=28108 RepID=UPI00057F80FC|nr:polysaccharide pyruvyl transferase family protein [Alteromonas macleodii]KHT54523.1 hypothetical protein RJ43_08890 [Alteromonas macleodii]
MLNTIKQAFSKENEKKINPFEWLKHKVSEENLKVVLFGAPGNLGDMLIVAATIQNLETHGIPFQVGQQNFEDNLDGNELFVIMGSGNYVPLYSGVKNILNKLSKVCPQSQVVVLPSSTYGMQEHIQSLDLQLYFFCRELDTYKRMKSALPKGRALLTHDAALYLDIKDSRFRAMRNLRQVLNGRTVKTLHAMRGDLEKTDAFTIEKRHKNVDISLLRTNRGNAFLSTYVINVDAVFEDVNFMLMYLLPFNPIVTNRLHVCIAALLLDKKVEIYDNSYGKLSGVYKNSLEELYPGKIKIHA